MLAQLPPRRLLVVDDEPDFCDLVCEIARGLDIDGAAARDKAEFARRLAEGSPDLVVLDLALSDTDGMALLRELAALKAPGDIVIVSGFDAKVRHTAMHFAKGLGLNVIGTLQKPIDIAELEALIRASMRDQAPISEADLLAGIAGGELVVHYQPQVSLGLNGRLAHVEALVRWRHPSQGLLPPGRFLPLATAPNLLGPLTETVLSTVVRQLGQWNAQGHAIAASINFPPQLLTDLTFPDRIAELALSNGVAARQIVLEVTESGAMEDISSAMDILTRFRLKGLGLSLDDFGTGYSSLVALYRMPFNELKIDQSFVRDAIANEEARSIVKLSVILAHTLGLKVCAEGVESRACLDLARDAGCDLFQGYLFSRPEPGEKIPDIIRTLSERRSEFGLLDVPPASRPRP